MAMITPANKLYCYHFDANGNTVAITDENENIVNRYAYLPFGMIANENETISQPFKYVGQHGVMTEPNGFYYMRARYYDPEIGRFISEDPIGFDGGDVNLYAYVGNNPVNAIDPKGLYVSVVWRPLRNGMWIFGYHKAISVNGDIYGFSPKGVNKEDSSHYGWGSHEKIIYSNEYDQDTLNYLKNATQGNDPRFTKDTYNLPTNNCMSFVVLLFC